MSTRTEFVQVRQRLLYVDDEKPLVEVMTRAMARLGYKVTGCSDPREAQAIFRDGPQSFDVVVSDISMPYLSGLDLAQSILEIRPDIPIVLTSGHIRPQYREAAARMGIRELILKPDDMHDLARALHRIFTGEGG